MSKSIYIIGAGSHSKVVEEVANLNNFKVVSKVENDKIFLTQSHSVNLVLNGLGATKNTILRRKIYENYKEKGFVFETITHPSSIVSSSAILSEGVQVFAGAIIQPDVEIGCNTLINTGAIIDHDCKIGSHVHIAPGVTMSGGVKVGENSFIGIGARIIQNILIGKNCLIAAGAVVINDVPDNSVVMGVPAKIKLD